MRPSVIVSLGSALVLAGAGVLIPGVVAARDPVNCKTINRLGRPSGVPDKLAKAMVQYCAAQAKWLEAKARVTLDKDGKAHNTDSELMNTYEAYQKAYRNYIEAVSNPK